MPFLSLDADLPPARRVIIAGPSGSGKTTACALVSDRIGVPHHEIDALFHGPGWQPRPQFHDDVARFVATEAWVTEWQYGEVRGLLAERAELLIWLDLPRGTVTRQVVSRTLRRRLFRQELWNGNTEGPLRTFFTDPEHIVRWSWQGHARYRGLIGDVAALRPQLPIVRVCSRRELTHLIERLSRA